MASLKKQSSITNQFSRHVAYCKKIPVGTLVFELKERLRNITSLYQEFRDLQDQIEETCGDELINDQFELRAQIEDYYFLCASALQSEIDKLNRAQDAQVPPVNNNRNNQGNQASDIKLERINIPVFTGDYKNWPEFKDLFSSLVHTNTSLGDVQKFHYLKNKVSGEALNLIKSLHTTGANYPEAWKRINDRYEHKRFIVDCHLKSFFSQKAISSEDSLAIKQLIDNSTEIMRSLQVLGLPVNQWDSILVHVVASKLDKETHKHWELTLKKDNLPTFKELETFLETRWQSLEMIDNSKTETPPKIQQLNNFKPNNNKNYQNSTNKPSSTQRPSFNNSIKSNQCIYCNNSGHMISQCPEYISLSPESKSNCIKSKSLCFNCLKPGHSLTACTNKGTCQQCGKRHHTSLHRTNQPQSSNASNSDNSTTPIVARAVLRSQSPSALVKREKLLATAIVKIKNSSGQFIRIRALVDLGSGYTLITEKLAKKLGFIPKIQSIPIVGIGEVVAQDKTSSINITIQSDIDQSFNLEVETFTMKVVTGDLPSAPVERKNWDHLQGLKLADDHYDRTPPIDLLLGVEVFEEIILDGILKKQDNSPTAMNSRLGWLLFGATASKISHYPEIKCHNVSIPPEDINATIKKFWELEEISTLRKLTVSEQQAEDIFKANVSINEEGRYEVSLLFNPSASGKMLGESRIAALFCLYRMEKRFLTNQTLKERYHKYIQNLIDSGHIERVPHNRLNIPV